MIKMIAGVNRNGVIGVYEDGSSIGKIPWNYPEDLKFFQYLTAGSYIIMGKETWKSIGKPLPNRENIVISRTKVEIPEVKTFDSLSAGINFAKSSMSKKDICLIGGAGIYHEGMQHVDQIYLTLIPSEFDSKNSVKFPWIDPQKFKMRNELFNIPNSSLKVSIYDRI